MTFIMVDKGLSKVAGLRAALEKIEASTGEKFRFTGAMYVARTGQTVFIEATGKNDTKRTLSYLN